jgi:GTP cyclohydrolase I
MKYTANQNMSADPTLDRAEVLADTELAVAQLLKALRIDPDHNTKDTPARVARMYVDEVFKGRYQPRPKLTDFPNVADLDSLYTIGPITVRSACSHHLVPIIGKLWIGVLPSDRVIGISKFVRLAEWVMARPQIQEEAVMQLANELQTLLNPRGVAVVMDAQHLCMTWRGVREAGTTMTSSVMLGAMRDNPDLKSEFMKLINR